MTTPASGMRAPMEQLAHDGQLRFHADANSSQTFQIKGLNQKALQEPARETLSFTTGQAITADKRIQTVVLEPHQDARARVNLLDRALAPAHIRVSQGAQGEVWLTTPAAQWPDVRDGLSVRGGGIRFAGPQFHRVATELQPEVMAPQHWSVEDTTSQRRTLQAVLPALQQVQQARHTVHGELQHAGARWHTDAALSAPARAEANSQWANDFAHEFAHIHERPAYAVFAALAPAVRGLNRERVHALLQPAAG